ncbi:glutamine synthetase III [Allofournierella massiliensis]|uniref:glutamine synthetase III family protein n=1 Tax=Allofournierella massiliensis TaxID=1650663 RepID=UPI0039A28141
MAPANTKEIYGSLVFNEHVMKERLPSATYKSLKATLQRGAALDLDLANIVASVMRDWAIENGATHYTHWFQPLTGITSEKHDSFLSPNRDGTAIMEFSGKELVKGESDASSFPNGGLRATAEARGYTAWDPTSYAFIKDGTLCIPTAFCSWTGEALDKKTPLLRSMKAVTTQAKRVLHLFGKDVSHVDVTVGPEQEYFLIKKEHYDAREDLILTGRTLFGAAPSKGQEMEEHYFGALREEVSAFMKDLDEELWKLGVSAKTKHNEVAPCQHELAPIFDRCNVAVDHNLLTMEMMKKLAPKHGLVCLLHEKPFDGVNGSGKHNNWSLSAPGMNLLDPGDTPKDNLQFLIFLAAIIKAVDEYNDLLRMSIVGAGNEHRLGGNEAPPAIVSIFMGEVLEGILDAIASGSEYVAPAAAKIDLGVEVLPQFAKDDTDRNRTSPFAFTGNKFEFRMPGSSVNISDANTVLNTAVAKELKGYADELEQAEDFDKAVVALIKRTIRDHKRVIFNGNGYSKEWEEEAARRGLKNEPSACEALGAFVDPKNIALFEQMGVLNEAECRSRYEVKLENYAKVRHIEAVTMLEMARRQLIPAASRYMGDIAKGMNRKKAACPGISCKAEEKVLRQLTNYTDAMSDAADRLEACVEKAERSKGALATGRCYHDVVLPAMADLRAAADAAESICGAEYWPLPSYSTMLFYV